MAAKDQKNDALSWGDALESDFPSSIIVFLVALPLCMGIAIASGAPPASGLITGIVGGIVVGLIAGSPLQVSGPAAGLFVLVAKVIEENSVTESGDIDLELGLAAMGMAVLGAGAIQLIAGLLRFGNIFRAVSPAVIQGMLSGIGVLILASQFHVMVDDKNAAQSFLDDGYPKGVANLVTIPQSFIKGILPLDGSPHFLAAAVGVGTIVVLLFWSAIPKNPLKVIPAPVVAVTLASVVAFGFGITLPPDELVAMEDKQNIPDEGRVKITQVMVPEDLTSEIRPPTLERLQQLPITGLLLSAVTIALVASAETMLCATAVDQMQSRVRTNYDRELTAQGVGNLICGGLGALPMTGVIVRSSANVDAGGRTRLSAILHGVWLLLFVAILPWVLNYIPMAALAAVLVFTGWKLINLKAIRKLFSVSTAEGMICLITLALVVGVDLLSGVLVGIACTAARLLYTFARFSIDVAENPSHSRTDLKLRGAATFLALPRLAEVLDGISPATELHVHLERLTYIDHACLEQFVNWEKSHAATGGRLVMDWEGLTAKFEDAGKSSVEETVHDGSQAALSAAVTKALDER